MKVRALILLCCALSACGQAKPTSVANDAGPVDAHGEGGASGEAGAGGATAALGAAGSSAGEAGEAGQGGAAAQLVLPALCATDTQTPPAHLVCTGLYADIASKQMAPGVRAYAPAVALWSDGAEKQRWISLPPGQVIDNSDPNEWVFPVGTRVWKEFSKAGQRVETRLWQKADDNYWLDATYAWNSDESSAVRSAGGDIPLGTGTYHIPTPDECQDCHRGRNDRILGFEQVLLGLAGATGLNLDHLIAEHLLSNPPKSTPLVIGDDGTGLAAPALAWLHVNCGTTCHNRNSSAKAWSTGMFLRLEPTQLNGGSVAAFDSLTTTIGVAAVTPTWKGQPRILPHDPAHSLLFSLISHRGTGVQMPPIATSVVDEANIPLVEAWIEQLPAAASTAGSGGTTSAGGGRGGKNGASGGTTSYGGSGGSNGGTTSIGGSNGGTTSIGGSNGGTTSIGGSNGGTGGGNGATTSYGGSGGSDTTSYGGTGAAGGSAGIDPSEVGAE